MPEILQAFPIAAPVQRVFDAASTAAGLDEWWTLRSSGEPREGADYVLFFGEAHDWRARVTRCSPPAEFELEMTRADADWLGSRVGFRLQPRDAGTWVEFYHIGWPATNEHYRISCHCWAMYLRVLRRFLENDESVPYERRLGV